MKKVTLLTLAISSLASGITTAAFASADTDIVRASRISYPNVDINKDEKIGYIDKVTYSEAI